MNQSNYRELLESAINPTIRCDERYHCESGDGFETIYQMIIVDDKNSFNFGEWVLKVKEVVNAYEKIQSHRESVDLNILLKKYALGDENALNQIQGQYIDTVGMPKTLAEMHARVTEAEEVFKSLPLDVRKDYSHNFSSWLRDVSTGKFDEYIAAKYPKKSAPKEASKEVSKSKVGENYE